ncbi:GPW/gp25 family protein [Saccharothrix sp. ST-888]|uniref:GPW/gp25 family protein n=1 Tax=Saccharothrix sp. ST-888 TaxID=1427391 RepID=UPI0018CE97F3|nr:GPW/gp25 family protein [Saccharothrix sp. ST-888]
MTIPFAIDSTGGVAQTDDLWRQLLDRIQALVGTQLGERVARADYGVDSAGLLFTSDQLASARMQLAVRDAVAAWEPSARVTSIRANVNDQLGLVGIQVEIAPNDTPGLESANSRIVQIGADGTVSSLGV